MSAVGTTGLQAPTRHLNRWWYVVTGFMTLLFGTTAVNVLFNILGKPMTQEFGWERSVISNGLSIETVLVGISIVILGFLIDRYGPKIPSVPMSLAFGIGLMLMSALPNNQLVFYLLCVVIGAGAGAVNPVAHSTVVSAWFQDRRGMALGILMAGLGSCGVLMPYLANWMLGIGGWRLAFLVIGAVHGHPGRRLRLRHPDAGRTRGRAHGRAPTRPDGRGVPPHRGPEVPAVLAALHRHLPGVVGNLRLMSQIVPMTTDKGISQGTAVSILSVLSLASVSARLLVGYLLDRFYAPAIGSIIFALCAVGVFLMITSSQTGLLFVGAVLIGLGLGSEGDLAAYMVSRYFPKHSYGRVLGFIYFLYAQGSAFGIFLLGQVYSATGSYRAGALPIIVLVGVGIVCLLLMGPTALPSITRRSTLSTRHRRRSRRSPVDTHRRPEGVRMTDGFHDAW